MVMMYKGSYADTRDKSKKKIGAGSWQEIDGSLARQPDGSPGGLCRDCMRNAQSMLPTYCRRERERERESGDYTWTCVYLFVDNLIHTTHNAHTYIHTLHAYTHTHISAHIQIG